MSRFTIAIHGGAGTILREDMTAELEAAYLDGLQTALNAGYAVLEEGGTAVNAVKAATVVLSPISTPANTNEQAPIMTFFPIFIPAAIIAPGPMYTLSSIETFPQIVTEGDK